MPKKKIVSNDLTPIKPYADYAIEILHTGSKVICDPPVKDTDDDWLFLCEPSSAKALEKQLKTDGFSIGGSQVSYKPTIYIDEPVAPPLNEPVTFSLEPGTITFYQPTWKKFVKRNINPKATFIKWPTIEEIAKREGLYHSWKKVPLNIVITCSPEYFENFVKATFLAKQLNLVRKDDRIDLFESILFDHWPQFQNLIITRDSEGIMKL